MAPESVDMPLITILDTRVRRTRKGRVGSRQPIFGPERLEHASLTRYVSDTASRVVQLWFPTPSATLAYLLLPKTLPMLILCLLESMGNASSAILERYVEGS